MTDNSQTSSEIDQQLGEAGYTTDFMPVEGGQIRCLSCKQQFSAGEAQARSIGRTEGESDPDDETAVVAVTCAACSAKGTLTLQYGATAPSEDADVLSGLRV